MRRWAPSLLAALACLLASAVQAEDRPGDFDFYVLALSWSPTFCRTDSRGDPSQCGTGKGSGFVVHGLWPQHERGYPESCPTGHPLKVPSSLAAAMADVMPRNLVGYQWRKHGTCSGLPQQDYFALLRAARERIVVPEEFGASGRDQQISARAVEQAFVAANRGLSERAVAVSCKSEYVAEVRICMTRSLDFRRCAEVDGRGCQARRLLLPGAG